MQRRAGSEPGRGYVTASPGGPVPSPVRLWQEEVHKPGIYDLEVDTSLLSPQDCVGAIQRRLASAPEPLAFQTLAQLPIDGQ